MPLDADVLISQHGKAAHITIYWIHSQSSGPYRFSFGNYGYFVHRLCV